ncbi:hypothetical protein ACQ4PT_054916 [Festuca glaucescens]
MDHMMHVGHQHHVNLEEQCSSQQDAARTSSASVSVSRVAFVLAAIAFLSLVSSSFSGDAAFWASSGAALSATRQILAALCGFVTTKKALFILSNVIFLFLAADCRCFFGIRSTMAPSKSDDHQTASKLPPCAVQPVQPCGSYYSGSLYHGSNTTSAAGNCSEEQEKRQVTQERFRLEGDEANRVTLEAVVVEEPTCSGVAHELDKLEIDELNKKFEEFIQSRRINWIKEEEQVLQCQQV